MTNRERFETENEMKAAYLLYCEDCCLNGIPPKRLLSWMFEEHKEIEGPCSNCRFLLRRRMIPLGKETDMCLLRRETEKVITGKCGSYQPQGKHKPNCLSCRFALTGAATEDVLCRKDNEIHEDKEKCERWEENVS